MFFINLQNQEEKFEFPKVSIYNFPSGSQHPCSPDCFPNNLKLTELSLHRKERILDFEIQEAAHICINFKVILQHLENEKHLLV